MYRALLVCLLLAISTHHVYAAIQFTIGNPAITNNEISLTASISGLTSASCDASGKCYLQGTLRQVGASKYFSATKNNVDTWVDYISDPTIEYIQSTFFSFIPTDGGWNGLTHMRFAADDSDYHGPNDYELKLRRFTGKANSSAGDSNTITINLAVAQPTPSPSPTPTLTPSPSPTSTTTPTPSPIPKPSPSPSIRSSPSPTPAGDVEGASTEIDLSGFGSSPAPSPSLQGQAQKGPILNRTRAKTTLLVGVGLLMLAAASYFGYQHYLTRRNNSDV